MDYFSNDVKVYKRLNMSTLISTKQQYKDLKNFKGWNNKLSLRGEKVC